MKLKYRNKTNEIEKVNLIERKNLKLRWSKEKTNNLVTTSYPLLSNIK